MKKATFLFLSLISIFSVKADFFDKGNLRFYIESQTFPFIVTVTPTLFGSTSGDLIIPATVTENNITYTVIGIGGFAYSTELKSVTVPSGVKYIGDYAFFRCDKLQLINFSNTSLLTNIGSNAFAGCNSLTSISIPSSVTFIGDEAFGACSNLKTIDFNLSKITTLNRLVFNECANLNNITIPPTVTDIGIGAFMNCSSLETISIPSLVVDISDFAFQNCISLRYINFNKPTSLQNIGIKSFQNSAIDSLEIPSTVEKIGNSAFSNCVQLKKLVFSANSSLSIIDEAAFNGCPQLDTLILPSALTALCYGAFMGCSDLKYVNFRFPANIKSIGEWTFGFCSKLNSITIPGSVDIIENHAFEFCYNLKSLITKRALPIDLTNYPTAFSSILKDSCILYVPKGSLGLYRNADIWNHFLNIIEEGDISSNINNSNIDVSFNLFPNPATEYFKISGLSDNYTVYIYDTSGCLQLYKKIKPCEKVDISHLQKGVYILKANNHSLLLQIK